MKVEFINQYGALPDWLPQVTAEVAAAFTLSKQAATVVIIRNDYMTELNAGYRGKPGPTDVLSFPDDEAGYAGDIFIAWDVLVAQSGRFGKTLKGEYAFLLSHGMLHLLGYDHLEKDEEAEMLAVQAKYLSKTAYGKEIL